jgi:murein DD-endopeptidase MepM/ murein hydrolase activator NlpD
VPPSAAKPLPDEKVSAKTPETPDVSLATQTLVSSGRLGLPVQGKIVRAYSKGKNDGIDIAAAPGDPVKAAADGSIAAITADADQVPIIVVRHPDNLLTVYANVADISVKKGDRVRRGQPIAKLRDGDKAYVHFEVREGLESVDPVDYLK